MNELQKQITSDAIGRDTKMSDLYFSGDESDFGLGSTTTAATGDSTFGIKASDYVGATSATSDGSSSSWLDTAFDGKNIGTTLGGIGSAVKGIAGIYDAYNNKEYKDKIYKLEKDRVDREVAKQEKAQAGLEAAWG